MWFCKLTFVLIITVSVAYGLQSSKSQYDRFFITDNNLKETSRNQSIKTYEPTWESLDARPLPTWYDSGKVGVFLHWGVFSVPAMSNEWFWYNWKGFKSAAVVKYMTDNYPPRFTYQDFAREFTAEFYDPERWVDILKKAGAKYLVFSSKHHEGYTLWPSKYSFGWNVGDVGPNRDVLGDLAEAVRNSSDIKFGVYHSWFEWYNPLYLADSKAGFNTSRFVKSKALPELVELVTKYKPEVIWSDGDWEAPDTYWKSKEFLAWLYNSSPVKDTVVVNDRWGKGTPCKHGGFYNCEDKYNPGTLLPHKWENAMTVDKYSWGYRRNAAVGDFLTPEELISQLVSTVSCGGNFLINVGPTKEGIIAPILEERLLQMGQWLGVNGDAIYESNPWTVAQNDSITSGIWYTSKPNDKKIFAIILAQAWPQEGQDDKTKINLGSVDSKTVNIKNISMFGYSKKTLSFVPCSAPLCTKGILVTLPNVRPNQSPWAWTLVIEYN